MNQRNDVISPRRDWSADPDEFANALTHGLGFVLSVVAAIVLVVRVLREGDGWRVLGCLIYSSSLVALYAMSTLSHSCSTPSRKRLFRMLDQGCIYLLIVATYTPFSLAFLRALPWWLFLAVLWIIALFGFLSKTLLAHQVDGISIWLYLGLGWLPVVSASSLAGPVPLPGCGGCCSGACVTRWARSS